MPLQSRKMFTNCTRKKVVKRMPLQSRKILIMRTNKRTIKSTRFSPSVTAMMQEVEDDHNVHNRDYSDDVKNTNKRHDSSIQTFVINIRKGDEKIGHAKLILVDRETVKRGNFHDICHDYSSDLETVSKFICDNNGKANHHLNIHGHDSSCSGGFLYIQSFYLLNNTSNNKTSPCDQNSSGVNNINDNYDDYTRDGAEALRSILNHPKIYCKWSLAIYSLSCSQVTQNNKTTNSPRQIVSNVSITKPATNGEETVYNTTSLKFRPTKETHSFFRAGFRQVTPPLPRHGNSRDDACCHLFIVPTFCRHRILSHKEATSMIIKEAPDKPRPPTGKDSEIRQFVQQHINSSSSIGGFIPSNGQKEWVNKINDNNIVTTDSSSSSSSPRRRRNYLEEFEWSIRRLLKDGGSIERSFAIHECAKHAKMKELDILLRLAHNNNGDNLEGQKVFFSSKKQLINSKNEEYETPLMIAAKLGTKNILCVNPFHRDDKNNICAESSLLDICDKLIIHGADKTITDDIGLTALGHMRKEVVSNTCFVVGGYKAAMEKLEDLTRLLMPSTGPSLADNAILSLVSSVVTAVEKYSSSRVVGHEEINGPFMSDEGGEHAYFDHDYYDY